MYHPFIGTVVQIDKIRFPVFCQGIVVNGENGYLCKVNNLPEFEYALRVLFSSSGKLIGMKLASLERAKLFELKTVVRQYERVFGEIVP